MPIFIVRNSKATPGDAIEYITRSGKAAYVSVKNLMGGSDLSKQIMDTMRDFGKGDGYNERKYYHCKLSPSRAEIISLEDMHRYAEEMAEAVFDPDMQIVIATHFDSGNPHSHIIVGAMNPVTGKKLHYTMRDFAYMKDTANEIGLEYGLSPVDFRERSNTRVKQGELYARKTSKPTTKDLLRETICDAISVCVSEQEFLEYMKAQGIEITRSKTEYSYLYPGAKRAVRGDTLGEMFKKENILKAMFEMEKEESQYEDAFWDTSSEGDEDTASGNGDMMTELGKKELENWIADTRNKLSEPEEQTPAPVAEAQVEQPDKEDKIVPLPGTDEKKPEIKSLDVKGADATSTHSSAPVEAVKSPEPARRQSVGSTFTNNATEFRKWKENDEKEWAKKKEEAQRKHSLRVVAIKYGPVYRRKEDMKEEEERFTEEIRQLCQERIEKWKDWLRAHTDKDVDQYDSSVATILARPSKATRDDKPTAEPVDRTPYSAWQKPEDNPKPRHDDYDDKFLSK